MYTYPSPRSSLIAWLITQALAVSSTPMISADLNVSNVTIKKTCARHNTQTPETGFWAKVEAGIIEHPQGAMPPSDAKQYRQREQSVYIHDDYLIQRGRCEGTTGVGQRLARWFKARGWDRKQVSHEIRKLRLSRYLLSTCDLVVTSKQAGHATNKMTEEVYLDVLRKHKATIDLPTG